MHAQEEARLLNHSYIGTEHILLGLVHEGEGVAARALESLGISLEKIRQQVEAIVGAGQFPPGGHMPFSPRAKKVLEQSLRETLQLGHNYVGTEHILLGLIREGEGVAAQVLVKLGADLVRTRRQVMELLAGRSVSVGEEASQSVHVSEDGPTCPQCRTRLVESLACRVLNAAEEEAERAHPALVVYCGNCGATLGVLPPPV
jgi:ATP-dependent Clp protease ATP-binding subunit ClpC